MGWTPPRGGGGGGGFSVDVQGLKLDLHIEKPVPERVADALIACDVDQRHGEEKRKKKVAKTCASFVAGKFVRIFYIFCGLRFHDPFSSVSYRHVSYCHVSYRIVTYRIVTYRIVTYRIVSYRPSFYLRWCSCVCVCVCVCVCCFHFGFL